MFRLKIALLAFGIISAHMTVLLDSADAGLLRDWLNRRRALRAQRAGLLARTPQQANAASGLQPGQCATTCQRTCSRVVVNYVPQTSYRTTYQRVPVTQFRPQTTTDPCTGCTVTCMRPCTTFTYRVNRVPYTTYRPVYRRETYRVPVTTITDNCNTCGTCATGFAGSTVGNGSFGTGSTGALSTTGTFDSVTPGTTLPSPSPADQVPSINSPGQGNSVISNEGGSTSRSQIPDRQNWELTSSSAKKRVTRDSYTAVAAGTATSPVTKPWKYSVRQASYVSLDAPQTEKVGTIRGQFSPVSDSNNVSEQTDTSAINANAGWKSVSW